MSRVGRRYARALFNLAGGDVALAKSRQASMETVGGIFRGADSGRILRSPVMPVALKRSLLDYAVSVSSADAVVTDFVKTLLDVGRVTEIPGIIEAHRELIDIAQGISRAEVVSAVALPEADLEAIATSLGSTLKQRVTVTQRQDPALLGGFLVRVGNYLVDMTLKTRLDSMAHSAVQSGH